MLSLVSSLASVQVYYAVTPKEEVALPAGSAWAAVGVLSGAWVAVFAAFLLLIDSKLIGSFFSTETCREWVCKKFTDPGASDQAKMSIHEKNHKKWRSIRADVKAWTHDNWARFEEEQPAWFSPDFVARIDDEMIPRDALVRLNRAAGGQRRRSSVGGSLREAAASTASARERGRARDRGGARVAPAAGAD
jgi:hypothetical protein